MDTTIKPSHGWPPELDAGADRGLWKSTVAAANQALEAAKGMQAAVGQTLKLQQCSGSLGEFLKQQGKFIDKRWH